MSTSLPDAPVPASSQEGYLMNCRLLVMKLGPLLSLTFPTPSSELKSVINALP